MVYCDYNFYANEYLLGRAALISATDFNFYATKASKAIDCATHNCTTNSEAVKWCCCELSELMFCRDNEKQSISSEKVGEFSVSYQHLTDSDFDKRVNSVIRKSLIDTGLLYCGVK